MTGSESVLESHLWRSMELAGKSSTVRRPQRSWGFSGTHLRPVVFLGIWKDRNYVQHILQNQKRTLSATPPDEPHPDDVPSTPTKMAGLGLTLNPGRSIVSLPRPLRVFFLVRSYLFLVGTLSGDTRRTVSFSGPNQHPFSLVVFVGWCFVTSFRVWVLCRCKITYKTFFLSKTTHTSGIVEPQRWITQQKWFRERFLEIPLFMSVHR